MMENYNPIPEETPKEEKDGFFTKARKYITPILAAGTLASCGPNSDGQKEHEEDRPDRFDKISKKIDSTLEEGKKVVDLARVMGIDIPEGVPVEYEKRNGVVVSFTVLGKKVLVEDLLKLKNLDTVKNKNDAHSAETRTNPEVGDFVSDDENKFKSNGTGDQKINSEISKF